MVLYLPHLPAWIRALLKKRFFQPCRRHRALKKNSKKFICLSCCIPICRHCKPAHHSHHRLKIRKYMNFYWVIREDGASKWIDCRGVQTEMLGDHEVVFLNQRPPETWGTCNYCITCDLGIKQKNHYCCLACKIQDMQECGIERWQYIHYNCDVLERQTVPPAEEDVSDQESCRRKRRCSRSTSPVVLTTQR